MINLRLRVIIRRFKEYFLIIQCGFDAFELFNKVIFKEIRFKFLERLLILREYFILFIQIECVEVFLSET